MGLTVRGDGTGTAYQVSSVWWNDYYDLLTGAMTDQAVELNYRPGSGTTPTLTIDGDGFGPLLKGLKTDHSTSAFSFDSSGNLTLAGSASVATGLTLSGGRTDPSSDTTVRIIRSTTASTLDVVQGTSGLRIIANSGAAYTPVFKVDASGNITSTSNNYNVPAIVPNGTTAGRQIFLGTATPTGANEGDIWIKA